jgi:hypothetical protein
MAAASCQCCAATARIIRMAKNPSLVVAGPDPAIHPTSMKRFSMERGF